MRGRTARIALLLGVPIVLLLAGQLLARRPARQDVQAVRGELESRALDLQRDFLAAMEQAGEIARLALSRSPGAALREARSGPLAGRLEGLGIVGAGGKLESWEGIPEEPKIASAPPASRWRVEVDGLTSRLVVSTRPDDSERSGTATFVLHSPSQDLPFSAVLPASLTRGPLRDVEFLDSDEPREDLDGVFREKVGLFREGPPASVHVALRSPDGEVLALATLDESPSWRRAAEDRAGAATAAAAAFCVLLVALFEWRAACETWPGLLACAASVVAGRLALLASRAPAQILPRELASASVYGSPAAAGLLASPADALLTCLALFLIAVSVQRYLRKAWGARLRLACSLAFSAGAGVLGFLAWLSSDLARNARLPILRLDAPIQSSGPLALLLGLGFAILGSAELFALPWTLLRQRSRSPAAPAGRLAVAVAALPCVALSTAVLLSTTTRLARDRLRSEFAPQVLEQSSRRQVALLGAVREAVQSERAVDTLSAPSRPRDEFAAYLLWVDGDLFHGGFKSSLDLFSLAGEPRSHFAFGLPQLKEAPPEPDASARDVVVRIEDSPIGAARQHLLHAEAPVLDPNGARVGTVVGHVLEEPDNLPFLPGSATFLAALGPGAPRYTASDPSGTPDYVLYDESGAVLLSTLHQPPAADPRIRIAASQQGSIELSIAGQSYAALPLKSGDRLHVLLLPELSPLDELGAAVRLALLVLGLLVALFLGRSLFRRGGLSALREAVRASFYRKLLATLLLASIVPLLGLAFMVRGVLKRREEAGLVDSSTQIVATVARVVEDYVAVQPPEPSGKGPPINDEVLQWLRGIVRQDIHLYEDGVLRASSRRELFSSGFLLRRLPGDVDEQVVRGRRPYLFRPGQIASNPIPTVYGRVRLAGPAGATVVAVPVVAQQQDVARALSRVTEFLLLATVLLGGLLAAAASLLARTVARPVRELVDATGRIASGDYAARLRASTRDEVADLVEGFNAMASALAAQRADLVRRRDYMEALLQNATTGVISTDALGRIITLNPAAVLLLFPEGGSPRVGEELGAAVSRAAELAPLAEVLRERSSVPGGPREVDLQRGAKPVRWRVVRVALPDPSGGPPGTLLLLDDVTDLMRSNQLEAWAEMARAIAHEIKNPLTPIQLSADHLRRLLEDRGSERWPEIAACLDTVAKQVRALREIAAEFSAYAKLPTLDPQATDPVAFVREIAATYRAGKPERIAIEERYEPAPAIAADRRVLSRALVNLVENALQAMPGGGTLTFSVAADTRGGGAVLAICDTGPGLDLAVRRRLFEPYFSTKSSGTGLGLAIVRRAVEAHGGVIEVESGAGRGTEFRLRMPAASSPRSR